jgi:nucleotide-binding universal stress UspA family protein
MSARPTIDRAPVRVLLALHGHEPEVWAHDIARVVATWSEPSLRVLAVADGTCPPVTSLTPAARRLHAAARATHRLEEDRRLDVVLARIVPLLPPDGAVVRVRAAAGDVARTIAAQAGEWPADVVVIGAPAPGMRRWLWPGPVHRDILGLTTCAVLVTPAPPVTPGRARRVTPRVLRLWPAPAGRKA